MWKFVSLPLSTVMHRLRMQFFVTVSSLQQFLELLCSYPLIPRPIIAGWGLLCSATLVYLVGFGLFFFFWLRLLNLFVCLFLIWLTLLFCFRLWCNRFNQQKKYFENHHCVFCFQPELFLYGSLWMRHNCMYLPYHLSLQTDA